MLISAFSLLRVCVLFCQDIVECLIDLRQREPRVTAAVLDTLLALSMDDQTKAEVVSSLLDGVAGQPVEDLPATVGFIVQAAGGSSLEGKEAKEQLGKTLTRLRSALNHSNLSSYSYSVSSAMRGHARRSAAGASQRRGGGAAESGSAAPFMVLEALSQSFRHHPAIAVGWLKAIQSCKVRRARQETHCCGLLRSLFALLFSPFVARVFVCAH